LRRCVNSAIAYARSNINIIVFFDGCDNEPCFNAFEPPPNVIKYVAFYHRGYYVNVMNYALECLNSDFDDEDLFVTCNNDQEFMVPGWDRIASKALFDYFPDGMGVVEIGNHADLSYNTFISRTSFWTKYYDGQLFDPQFTQYYADADRLQELESKDQFARIYPGLVNTHSMFDEVWHEGRQFMTRDKEVFDEKHESG